MLPAAGTANWLQRYVYFRTGNSLYGTYFVSAFWHGFYPGYYLFFLSIALVQSLARAWQKKVTPYFAGGPLEKVYDAVTILGFSAYVNYFSIVFQLLALDRSLIVWGSFYYIGHIVTIVAFALTTLVPTKKVAKKTE
jgi:hypothetical protein